MNYIKVLFKFFFPSSSWKYFSFLNEFFFRSDSLVLKRISFLKNKNSIIVLGNGPSLKKDIDCILSNLDNDFMCVNYFANTSYYEKLKPNKYVFIDYGLFFSHESPSSVLEKRKELIDAINNKTTWKMQIFLPAYSNADLYTSLIKNKNIEIVKINVLSLNLSNPKKYFSGFYAPSASNVLIYAVFLSIWSGHDKVKIFGADFSYINDLHVDQHNNDVVMNPSHFYSDGQTRKVCLPPLYEVGISMAEQMQELADTHKAHDLINKFAMLKGVEIVNCSSYSLIDSYKRLNVND